MGEGVGEGLGEPGSRGIDRRQLLKRGVGAGVALIWAVPTVETLTQVSAAAGSLPPPPPRCASDKDDPWPPWVHGRPDPLHYGSAKGVYLWNDGQWHLDVTQPIGDPHEVFSGTIMTAGRIFGVVPVTLQRDDHWKLSPDGHTLTFRFVNHTRMINGLIFSTLCADKLYVALDLNGHQIPRSRVFIGDAVRHPASVPFTIKKHDDAPH